MTPAYPSGAISYPSLRHNQTRDPYWMGTLTTSYAVHIMCCAYILKLANLKVFRFLFDFNPELQIRIPHWDLQLRFAFRNQVNKIISHPGQPKLWDSLAWRTWRKFIVIQSAAH